MVSSIEVNFKTERSNIMKLKKVLALILSASLLAAAFAGCGGDGESQTSSAASASSGTGTSETGDGGGIPEEPEELTLPISEDGADQL